MGKNPCSSLITECDLLSVESSIRGGNRGHKVRDRFPFMLPYVENESNQFSLDLQVF